MHSAFSLSHSGTMYYSFSILAITLEMQPGARAAHLLVPQTPLLLPLAAGGASPMLSTYFLKPVLPPLQRQAHYLQSW